MPAVYHLYFIQRDSETHNRFFGLNRKRRPDALMDLSLILIGLGGGGFCGNIRSVGNYF